MTVPASILINSASLGGWTSPENGAVALAAGETVSVKLESYAGIQVWSLDVYGTDELVTAPTITQAADPTGTATFTAPASPAAGWALLLRSQVGSNSLGHDIQGSVVDGYTSLSKVYLPTSGSLQVLCLNERWEGNTTAAWAASVNALIRSGVSATALPPALVGDVGKILAVDGASVVSWHALAGDVTGIVTATVVEKVHGTTYPATSAADVGKVPAVDADDVVTYHDPATLEGLTGRDWDDFTPNSTTVPTWEPLFTMLTTVPIGGNVKVKWIKTKKDTGASPHVYTTEAGSTEIKVQWDGTNTTSTLPSLGLSTGPKKILRVDTDTFVVARLGDTDPVGALTLITYTDGGVAEVVGQIDDISEIVDMAWDGSTLVVAGTAFGVSHLYVVSVEGLAVVGDARLDGLVAQSIDVLGDYVAVVGLLVSTPTFMYVDITDRTAPDIKDTETLGKSSVGVLFGTASTDVYCVCVDGTTGYVYLYDCSTPGSVSLADTLTSANKPWSTFCREVTPSSRDYIYLGYTGKLAVIDISTTPTAIEAEVSLSSTPTSMVFDTTAQFVFYASDAECTLGAVDVQTPASPVETNNDELTIPEVGADFAVTSLAKEPAAQVIVVGEGYDQPTCLEYVDGSPPVFELVHRVPAVGLPVAMAKAWDDPIIYMAAFKDTGVGTVTTKVEYIVEWSLSAHP